MRVRTLGGRVEDARVARRVPLMGTFHRLYILTWARPCAHAKRRPSSRQNARALRVAYQPRVNRARYAIKGARQQHSHHERERESVTAI